VQDADHIPLRVNPIDRLLLLADAVRPLRLSAFPVALPADTTNSTRALPASTRKAESI